MSDTKKPTVEPEDWITIGKEGRVNAVVSNIYSDDYPLGDIEVVYLDGGRAINEDVVWRDDHWDFKNKRPSGGYADNYTRLSKFVAILRSGRFAR